MMHSLPGIRFHTRVRYVSAGLNSLKSELSISVNCYTSVNVDLSMSLNCSFFIWGMYVRTENGDLPRVEEGNTGSTPVYSTMQKELGIEANCLGRTIDYLLLRKKLT